MGQEPETPGSRPGHQEREKSGSDSTNEERERAASGSTEDQRLTGVRPIGVDPPRPKRGAFPTPKAEIESATPFVPDSDQVEEESAERPAQLTEADQHDAGRGESHGS